MAQLCLWTKIRTKQWLVLGALVFQCMRVGFLCPKRDNFACLHTRQYQNELHLKRWFFLAKIGIFCKSICYNISQCCISVFTTIFVRSWKKPLFLFSPTLRRRTIFIQCFELEYRKIIFRGKKRVGTVWQILKWASSEKMISFLPKSASSVSQLQAHLAKHCSSVYTTIFVRRKGKTNSLSNQT